MVRLACAYVRVSTTQQARHAISMPDQVKQIRKYAQDNHFSIVAEYVEPGASARSENRPVLQEMLERALGPEPGFSAILVHSLSRFFRDEVLFEVFRRKCEANGVDIISITQDFGSGEGSELARRVMALADELNSKETSKHVRRSMMENARQGFHNGSTAPFGYETVTAELRGQKQKKKLGICAEQAEVVRLIYKLASEGDGVFGPLGTKNIAKHLNKCGHKTAKGGQFSSGFINRILHDETYIGKLYYNRTNSKTGKDRPKSEWIPVAVPSIVSEAAFERVQLALEARQFKCIPPRTVNSPVLLSGLAFCECGMSLLFQYSKGGKYTYYACSGVVRHGICKTGAKTRVSAPIIDKLVLDQVMYQVLTAERVRSIVAEIINKRSSEKEGTVTSITRLRCDKATEERKLTRLMTALANGTLDPSETFAAAVRKHEENKARLSQLIANHEKTLESTIRPISLDEAECFASHFRDKLAAAEPSLKKRILRTFVSRILVRRNVILVSGAKSDLAEIVTGTRSYV